MSSILFLIVIVSEYCFLCCPNGYTLCAVEGETCNEVGLIAFGNDNNLKTYTYQETSQAVNCGTALFGNPVSGELKQCCYQNPVLSGPNGISPIVRNIECNETISGFIENSETIHYYQLITNSIYDITFNLCDVSFDATLTVYNSNGNAISLGVCDGSASRPLYGDQCDSEGICGNSIKEAFTLLNKVDSTYYIRIGYHSSLSPWHDVPYSIGVTCDGTLYPTTTPTTFMPTTSMPITAIPTTITPTTFSPTTSIPTQTPTTSVPTTFEPTTLNPTTSAPTTFSPTVLPSKVPSTNPTDKPTVMPSLSLEREVKTSSVINSGSQDFDNLNSDSTSIDLLAIGIILGVLICIVLIFILCRKMKKNNGNKVLSETVTTLELTENNNMVAHRIQNVSSINDTMHQSNNDGMHDDIDVLNNVNKITAGDMDDVNGILLCSDGETNDIDVLNDGNKITNGNNANIDIDNDVDILDEVNHVTIGNNETIDDNTPKIKEDEFIVQNNDIDGRYYEEGI